MHSVNSCYSTPYNVLAIPYCLQYRPRYVALITLIIPFLVIFALCIIILILVIAKTIQMNRSVGDLQDAHVKKRRKQRSLRFFGAISVLMGIWRLPLFFGLTYVAITPDPKDIPTGVSDFPNSKKLTL